jgi:5-formyltetrahydrofolate cyclo-ligase
VFPLPRRAAIAYSGGVKYELRNRLKTLLADMPPEDVRRKSQRACALLLSQEEFRDARKVMVYLALPAEADPGAVAQAAWREGKVVAAPKIDWDTETMSPAVISSLDNHTTVGRHGVRSPDDGLVLGIEELDLIVAPALGIDLHGNRLGRGGGYYDRFLAQHGVRAVICAMVFQEQMLEELPHAWHDRGVHMVVTDQQVMRF